MKNLRNSYPKQKIAYESEPTVIFVQSALPQTVTLLSAAVSIIAGAFTVTATYLSHRQHLAKQAAATVPPTLPLNTFKVEEQQKLHQMLDNNFDDLELQELCFDMGIDYEDLPAIGQTHKARELIELCTRRGCLPQLRQLIKTRRPHLFTGDVPTYQINQPHQATAVA